jgi:hypothetical protein
VQDLMAVERKQICVSAWVRFEQPFQLRLLVNALFDTPLLRRAVSAAATCAARTRVLNGRLTAGVASGSGAASGSGTASGFGAANVLNAASKSHKVDGDICNDDVLPRLLQSPSPHWEAIYCWLNELHELQNQPGTGGRPQKIQYPFPPLYIICDGISILKLRKQMHGFCHVQVLLCTRSKQNLLSGVLDMAVHSMKEWNDLLFGKGVGGIITAKLCSTPVDNSVFEQFRVKDEFNMAVHSAKEWNNLLFSKGIGGLIAAELCSTPVDNSVFEEFRVEDECNYTKHFIGTGAMHRLESWMSAIARFAFEANLGFFEDHIMWPVMLKTCMRTRAPKMIDFAHKQDALIRKIVAGSSVFDLHAGRWDLIGTKEACCVPIHTLYELVRKWQRGGIAAIRSTKPLLGAWPDILAPRGLQELSKAASDPKMAEQLSIARTAFQCCERDVAAAFSAVSWKVLFCPATSPMRISRPELWKDKF